MKKDLSGGESTGLQSRLYGKSGFGGSVEQQSAASKQREELSKSRLLEVRKQEDGLARAAREKLKNQQQAIVEEAQLLEAYQAYQAKLRQIEELKARKAEALKIWEESQAVAKLEEERRVREEIECLQKAKTDLAKARERERIALERAALERREIEQDKEKRRLAKQRAMEDERARAENAVKAYQEKISNMPQPPPISKDFDKVAGIGANRKRFNMKDFEQSHNHCVVRAEDEDDESEDANARALKVREETEQKKLQDAFHKEEMRQRAIEREKLAMNKLKREKELEELERKAREEKLKQSQLQVQTNIEHENIRLAGMRHLDVEKKFERKRQEKITSEFELMFFGKSSHPDVDQVPHERFIGDRINLIAFWKDPIDLVYETKKTMNWGPKNKKRDLEVPDIDELVHQRRMMKSRSQSREPQKESKSPEHIDIAAFPQGYNNVRDTLSKRRSNLGFSNEEVSFNYTEDESHLGGLPYTKSQLLEKYKSRDGQDSPLRNTAKRGDETLEMTISEDHSGDLLNIRPSSLAGQQSSEAIGRGFLQTGDIGSYLEEQQRILAQMERDRQLIKQQLAAEEAGAEDSDEEDSPRVAPLRDDIIKVRDELINGQHQAGQSRRHQKEDDDEDDEQPPVRLQSTSYRQQKIVKSDSEDEHEDSDKENDDQDQDSQEEARNQLRENEDALLSKFLTFKPDSKCRLSFT